MLVGEGTECVGTEVDEGLHVLFCESTSSNFALVVHGIVVVFVVRPARLADGFVGHLLSVLVLFLLLPGLASFGFAGFRLALGHGALLAGLARASVEGLAALLAVPLLAGVLLLLLLLSIAALVLLAVWILALLLLIIALVFWLAVTLVLTLLAIIVLAALLAVLLLLTVLRHSLGKLGLKDQVTS